jgi:hypothetical protein
MRLEDGTMVCCFNLKKSRNDWRICELVIMAIGIKRWKNIGPTIRPGVWSSKNQARELIRAGNAKRVGSCRRLGRTDATAGHAQRMESADQDFAEQDFH